MIPDESLNDDMRKTAVPITESIDHLLAADGVPHWQRVIVRRILEMPADHNMVIMAPPVMNVSAEIARMIEQIAYPDVHVISSSRTWRDGGYVAGDSR